VIDVEDMLNGYDLIEKLADSPHHIIAGHDPLTSQMYQPIDSKGLEIYSLTQPL
jgi:hypothetical protein